MTLCVDIVGDSIISTSGWYTSIPNWMGLTFIFCIFVLGWSIRALVRYLQKTGRKE